MEERTRAYLRGRFRDHYRRRPPSGPPDAEAREWGYIPFTAGPETTMVRHRSLLDLGRLGDFLVRERPRHVYFSAGRYEDPDAGTMDAKGWRDSDLVFDLDADHLPGVDEATPYAEMLDRCKDKLRSLLSLLREDFGFEDRTVVFSGGRGYHVHVRDEGIRDLGREARREIAEYVQGVELREEAYVRTVSRDGVNRRVLATDGGWGRRVHERLLAFLEELRDLDDDAALERLQSFEGIGEGRAGKILETARARPEAVEAGQLELGGTGMRRLVQRLAERAVDEESAHIDEPVTTDVNRLIRLPGSLHGGTGLLVREVDEADLGEFDPLADAVPETFRGHEVSVEVTDGGEVEFDTRTFTVPEGVQTLPEYAAVFLMARGRAEKGKEE
ncbi:MAG: DNA primase small subunit PriS [Halobacteriaceae archaeon]